MTGTLLSFGNWLQNRDFAQNILGSTWIFPYVQALHFSGLSLFVGTNLALDFNLVGFWKRQETPAELCSDLIVWNWIGFFIAITGGFLLFSSAATTYVVNPAFLTKLGFLIPVGLIIHIAIQRKVFDWSKAAELPRIAKIAGFVELIWWLSVATAAVLIPYLE